MQEYVSRTYKKGDSMWKIVVTYDDGTVKEVKAKNKIDAAMMRQSLLRTAGVIYADVFDGNDYIDPVEL